jgi:hypothetical protein
MREPDAARAAKRPLGGDVIIPALGCGLTVYYFVSTGDLVFEAKATGLVIGVVLIAFCAGLFARLLVQLAAGRGSLGLGELVANHPFNRQRLALAVLAVLFVATIHWVGTTLGLFLLLVGSMWTMGVRRLRTLLAVATVTAAVVHLLLISLLGSRLPLGLLQYLVSAPPSGA